MPQYKLVYFNARGRAEIIRLVFVAAGKEYEDFRFAREEWPNYKSKMPFQQVPVLEIIDGSNTTQLSQSFAITRYLANEFGLAGKSALEKAKIDMIGDQWIDLQNAVVQAHFESDETRKATLQKKFFEETIPTNFQFFENILKANKSGYYVGDSLSWIDLFSMALIDSFKDVIKPHFEKFPNLKDHYEKVKSLPRVADWLSKRPVTEM